MADALSRDGGVAQDVSDRTRLVRRIQTDAGHLFSVVSERTSSLVGPILERLNRGEIPSVATVTIPCWGGVQLQPAERLLVNSPLMQRLHGLRQLSTASYVYPAAMHSRLEHSLGAVACTQRILNSLLQRADETALRRAVESDVEAVRMAALLHNIAYCAFGDSIRPIAESRMSAELDAVRRTINEFFEDAYHADLFVVVAFLILISEPFLRVVTHPRFPARGQAQLPLRIASALLGSSRYLSVGGLGTLISGPVNVVALDGLLRDAFHIGFSIAFDVERLIRAFVIVDLPKHRTKSDRCGKQRPANQLSLAFTKVGLSAYEQFVLGREIFNNLVVDHKAVRAAHLMIQRLVTYHEAERGVPFNISDMLSDAGEQSWLTTLSRNHVSSAGGDRSELARRLTTRDLFKPALSFSPSHYTGLDQLTPEERADFRATMTRQTYRELGDERVRKELERRIALRAREITMENDEELPDTEMVRASHIIIEPPDTYQFRARPDVLVQLEDGSVVDASRYFNPVQWTEAYRATRHPTRVFCPQSMTVAVNRATRAIFSEEFSFAMAGAADDVDGSIEPLPPPSNLATGTSYARSPTEPPPPSTSPRLQGSNRSGPTRSRRRPKTLGQLEADNIVVPPKWIDCDPSLPEKLVTKLRESRPEGYAPSLLRTIRKVVRVFASFHDVMARGGTLKHVQIGQEAILQERFRDHVRSVGFETHEKARVAGGEIDLLFEDMVVEIKIHRDPTDRPLAVGETYALQARRYDVPNSTEVVALLVGYRPQTERGYLLGPDSLDIRRVRGYRIVEIRQCVAVSYTSPSRVRLN